MKQGYWIEEMIAKCGFVHARTITAKIHCSFVNSVVPLCTFHDCLQFPAGLVNLV
jgi:hypothetical protein